MKLETDREHGLAYLSLVDEIKPGEVARTVTVHPDINLDFDGCGALLGIEFLSEEGFARIREDLGTLPDA